MTKRTWVWAMGPSHYEITCDLCGGSANITWSEYEKLIWCFDCKKDTLGTGGVFDGPIPLKLTEMFGMTFDRIDLATGQRLKMTETPEGVEWKSPRS